MDGKKQIWKAASASLADELGTKQENNFVYRWVGKKKLGEKRSTK